MKEDPNPFKEPGGVRGDLEDARRSTGCRHDNWARRGPNPCSPGAAARALDSVPREQALAYYRAMTDAIAMQDELGEQRRRIDVDNYTITVRELLSMAERNELHRAPEYQRKFRWNEQAESRLIESLLLGLPVPNIFVATNPDGSWEVVDGLQRISTLIHFASDSAEQMAEIRKHDNLTLSGLRKAYPLQWEHFHKPAHPRAIGLY